MGAWRRIRASGPETGPMNKKSKAEDERPWMEFRLNAKCVAAECACCGYFWGPGNEELHGQKVVFNVGKVSGR
jgi:hypothetical protein